MNRLNNMREIPDGCVAIYQQTLYPNIFKYSRFCRQYFNIEELHFLNPEYQRVINNRNHFIQEFHIKTCRPRMPQYVLYACGILQVQYDGFNNLIDHLEYYKTLDNKYVVTTSLRRRLTDEDREKFAEYGWRPYESLCDFCTTYIFIMDARRR